MKSWMCKAVTLAAVGALISAGLVARADEINSGGLPVKNVTIEKVEGERLLYKTQSGQSNDKQISDKMKVTVTDEPNLTMAEESLAASKWSEAVDGYQKALRSSAKPWVKDFSAIRLLKAGEKSERFDAVVTAYLHLLNKDPAAAKDIKITYPADANSAYLKSAATLVDSALASEKDQAKAISLKVFRMNIAKAMKDEAAVVKLAGELQSSPTATASGALDAAALAGIIDGRLSLI